MTLQKIEIIVIQTLQDLVESLSLKDLDQLNKETVLFGDKGFLDSMGLVSLITDLEDKIEQEFNLDLILADERAISQKRSPFRTVSSLCDYILRLIKEHNRDEKQ